MNRESITVEFCMLSRNQVKEIEIPLYITANELVTALNSAYSLGIDPADIKSCYLRTENPIALLKGNRKLSDFGLRNGSTIYFA